MTTICNNCQSEVTDENVLITSEGCACKKCKTKIVDESFINWLEMAYKHDAQSIIEINRRLNNVIVGELTDEETTKIKKFLNEPD